ncbi:MAG: transcriptional regulator, LacI family [Glaciihabitans sp.]|nr:transcriptional regulator, LacI family [Glaciihabitans sp.]
MTDVAGLAGVSLKTVSRVINGVASVDAQMTDRVRAAVQELGFSPNQLAATLKSGSPTSTIGLIVKDITNEFYSSVTVGASAVARQHGTLLITAHSSEAYRAGERGASAGHAAGSLVASGAMDVDMDIDVGVDMDVDVDVDVHMKTDNETDTDAGADAGAKANTETDAETSDYAGAGYQELDAILDLCRRRVDGLLVVPTAADHSGLATQIAMGTPMVFLDRDPVNLAADTVVINNVGGARDAVRALVAQGHRRIAIIVDSVDLQTMAERLAGAEQALAEADIPLSDSFIVTGVHDPAAAATTIRGMLDAGDPPTAVFCGNNRITTGVIEELWRRGTPLAIAGFDRFPLAHLMPMPLTLVDYNSVELGRIGAEILFRRINGDDSPPQRVVLPTTLTSTGLEFSR